MENVKEILKNPFGNNRLRLGTSVLVLLCSVAVNAYVQITSFSSMTMWLLNLFGDKNPNAHLSQILEASQTSDFMRIMYGLLMTLFLLITALMLIRNHLATLAGVI